MTSANPLDEAQSQKLVAHVIEADAGIRAADENPAKYRIVPHARGSSPDPAHRFRTRWQGVNLKFGQPSLLRLSETEVLATHWAVEDGQGRILTHRLHVEA